MNPEMVIRHEIQFPMVSMDGFVTDEEWAAFEEQITLVFPRHTVSDAERVVIAGPAEDSVCRIPVKVVTALLAASSHRPLHGAVMALAVYWKESCGVEERVAWVRTGGLADLI